MPEHEKHRDKKKTQSNLHCKHETNEKQMGKKKQTKKKQSENPLYLQAVG